MGDELKKYIDGLLTKFGESLKCPEEFYEEGKELAQTVFERLKQYSKYIQEQESSEAEEQKSKYSVDRVYFGGSFGKKTDVLEPDLDLVVVCNSVEPPLLDVLDEFEDILTLNGNGLKIVPKPGHSEDDVFKKTERSLNFCFDNGIEVDLLPAANIRDVDDIGRKLKEDPKNPYYYNPSFIDKQIGLIASQHGSTHTLIRLVKFWFKNLYLGEKVNGGSAMMELISCAAAEEEKKLEALSMLRMFGKVMDIIIKLDSLKLVFRPVGEKWERVAIADLRIMNRRIFPPIVGNESTIEKRGFIIDPANPYQDFLEQEPTVIKKLKQFASTTRNRLTELMNQKKFGQDFIRSLFQPQPAALNKESSLLLPNNVLIDYSHSYSSIYCDMKVRKELVMDDVRKKVAIDVLKQRLLSDVNAVVKGNPVYLNVCNRNPNFGGKPVNLDDIREAVQNRVKESFQVSLGLGGGRHEDMDVTLSIPYQLNDKGYAVLFSMSWK